MKTMGDDIVEHFLCASTHDNLMFFTDSGKVFQTQVYEIPEGTRVARGRGLLNFLELSTEEKVLSLVPIKKDEAGKFKYLVMVTKNGRIKKTSLQEFDNVRKSGIIAIKLEKGTVFTGKHLARFLKGAGDVRLFLVTIGDGIEHAATSLMHKGEHLHGYILDRIGSLAVEFLAENLENASPDKC